MKCIRILLSMALLSATGAFAAPSAAAAPGRAGIGVEAGLPLVAGFEVSYRVQPQWRLGLQFGRVSGLSVFGAEARWLPRGERARLVPSLVAGAEQYALEDAGLDATPVGMHAAFGLDYRFDAPVSVGVELGVLTTFGASGSDRVKVFSIGKDVTRAMFNLGVRYQF